jgi:monoamine oxidase
VQYDVVVVGAGLAGLSAARDLMKAGSDVLLVEARNRPGGRVEQTTLADGRIVQLGGEVIGPFHESYLGLAEELGLTIVPSFPQLPGQDTRVLADGRYVGDGFPWMSDADRASFAALSDEFGALATTVDPDDPWSHPDAERLDRLSPSRPRKRSSRRSSPKRWWTPSARRRARRRPSSSAAGGSTRSHSGTSPAGARAT